MSHQTLERVEFPVFDERLVAARFGRARHVLQPGPREDFGDAEPRDLLHALLPLPAAGGLQRGPLPGRRARGQGRGEERKETQEDRRSVNVVQGQSQDEVPGQKAKHAVAVGRVHGQVICGRLVLRARVRVSHA